jgi:hypothetical protein
MWTPSIVPNGDNQDVYLVADDFGQHGRAWCEADIEATDLETVTQRLLEGQYNNPGRVVTLQYRRKWSQDVSEEIAHELRRRCDLQMRELPKSIQGFVERHEGHYRQLTLRLARNKNPRAWDWKAKAK